MQKVNPMFSAVFYDSNKDIFIASQQVSSILRSAPTGVGAAIVSE